MIPTLPTGSISIQDIKLLHARLASDTDLDSLPIRHLAQKTAGTQISMDDLRGKTPMTFSGPMDYYYMRGDIYRVQPMASDSVTNVSPWLPNAVTGGFPAFVGSGGMYCSIMFPEDLTQTNYLVFTPYGIELCSRATVNSLPRGIRIDVRTLINYPSLPARYEVAVIPLPETDLFGGTW